MFTCNVMDSSRVFGAMWVRGRLVDRICDFDVVDGLKARRFWGADPCF
jgi:hypothetical protein